MLVPSHYTVVRDPKFQLASAGLMGTTQQISLPYLLPVQEFAVRVTFCVNTAISALSATASVNACENILALCKRIRLNATVAGNSKTLVDFSGPGLLEWATQVGLTLDPSTNWLIGMANQFYNGGSGGGSPPAAGCTIPAGTYHLTYRVPLTHPGIGEPLRLRTMSPWHLFDNAPTLSIDFASQAELYSTGSINNLYVEVFVIQADWNTNREAALNKTGGWLLSDLVEINYGFPVGQSSEQKIPLNTGGWYTGLLARQYLGGTYLARQPVDSSGLGTTFGPIGTGQNAGLENIWRIEVAGTKIKEFAWRDIQILNSWSRPNTTLPIPQFIGQSAAGGTYSQIATVPFIGCPSPGGLAIAGTNIQPAASCLLDFLEDGTTGDTSTDFGSCLNANVSNGALVQLIGTPIAVTGNASIMFIGGHRIFGSLANWQSVL